MSDDDTKFKRPPSDSEPLWSQRRPLPPGDRVGALQDTVHTTPGRARSRKAARLRRSISLERVWEIRDGFALARLNGEMLTDAQTAILETLDTLMVERIVLPQPLPDWVESLVCDELKKMEDGMSDLERYLELEERLRCCISEEEQDRISHQMDCVWLDLSDRDKDFLNGRNVNEHKALNARASVFTMPVLPGDERSDAIVERLVSKRPKKT